MSIKISHQQFRLMCLSIALLMTVPVASIAVESVQHLGGQASHGELKEDTVVDRRMPTEEAMDQQSQSEQNKPVCVILLHGLARTTSSMNVMQDALSEHGFVVANTGYPSRKLPIETLAVPAVSRGLAECAKHGVASAHVVTHSMGGILIRQYLAEVGGVAIDRIVMLAPPNKGSEAVDALKDAPGFQWLNGPAGMQLGTDDNSVPLALGPIKADVGIIAGTSTINFILSTYLPDPDDGKVSVSSTRLDGMCAHLQIEVSHPFIMEDEEVISNVIEYLQTGKFLTTSAEYFNCKNR